jgi:hypothetical protein
LRSPRGHESGPETASCDRQLCVWSWSYRPLPDVDPKQVLRNWKGSARLCKQKAGSGNHSPRLLSHGCPCTARRLQLRPSLTDVEPPRGTREPREPKPPGHSKRTAARSVMNTLRLVVKPGRERRETPVLDSDSRPSQRFVRAVHPLPSGPTHNGQVWCRRSIPAVPPQYGPNRTKVNPAPDSPDHRDGRHPDAFSQLRASRDQGREEEVDHDARATSSNNSTASRLF